jgi:hypothetical protein
VSRRRTFDKHYAFASELWARCEAQAKRLTGRQVLNALEAASAAVYFVGYDDAFQRLRHGAALTPAAVGSHDVGWLTVFAIELQKRATRRRKKA